jgi:hypothetical protein
MISASNIACDLARPLRDARWSFLAMATWN